MILDDMSSKGQTLGLAVLYSLFFFVFGILFINFLQPDIISVQNSLSCSSPLTISDGTKIVCLMVDGVMPYFIIGIVSVAMGAITARLGA